MEFIIILLIIITNAVAISNILKQKVELTIPIATITIALIVYTLGLFNNLNLGVKIVELLSIIVTIYNVIHFSKSKKIQEEIKRIITPGLLVYIALVIVVIIINKGRIFEHYDEFNHWAVIIKNMFLYNGYGTVEQSIVTFNEYPPFTAVFQYILLNIKGEYSEDLIIISHNILYLSIIIPICKNIEWGKKLKNLLLVIPIIAILPLILYEDFFANILVDGLLGIFFAIGLFTIYNNAENKKYYNVLLSCIMAALALTKTTGVALSGLLLIFKLIKAILERKHINLKTELKAILLIAIIPVILTSSWYIKINMEQAQREWLIKEQAEQEIRIENSNIISNFLKAFFDNNKITSRNLNMFCSIILLGTYSMLIYKREKDKQGRKNYVYVLIATIISVILFAIGLLMVYLTLFTRIEAEVIGCYERYMSTMLIAWMFLNTLILCNKDISPSLICVFIAITIVLMPAKTIDTKYIQYNQYITNLHTKREYYTPLTKYKSLFTENVKIFFMSYTDMHDEKILNINKYELMGINIENESLKVTNNKAKRILTNKQLEKTLLEGDYTYMYVYKIKDKLKNRYTDLFKDSEILNDTLYKVKIENDNIILEVV